jgi:hypothetical protein
MSKRKRCPNKTRRSRSGKCVPYVDRSVSLNEYSNPKDTNVFGYYNFFSKPNSQSSEAKLEEKKTYRTAYYNKFFNKPISILENTFLFQVYVNDVNQFFDYESIHTKSKKNNKYNDCFLHSLFSLGLRNRSDIDKDVSDLYANPKIKGVITRDITTFLETSFGLPKKSIQIVNYNMPKQQILQRNYTTLTTLLKDWLAPSYATILLIVLLNTTTNISFGHAITAFNYESKIIYFDSQNGNYSNNLSTLFTNEYVIVIYSLITVWVTEPKTIVSPTCRIPFS